MLLRRASLRALLAGNALWYRPLAADGLVLDPMQSALVQVARRMRARMGQASLATLRARYDAGPGLTGLWPDRSVRTEEVTVAGRPARRYLPPGEARGDLFYLHGGGFIMGSLGTHDPLCRLLARRARMRVLALDYRLAPEHRFPCGWEDAQAGWAWARASGGGPWAVAGDSAGANLAAGLALDGSPVVQLLLYPVVDMADRGGPYRSLELFGTGYMLETEILEQCLDCLLPQGQDPADERLSPIRADLSRASPALIVTAGFDPLRDQGRAYKVALEEAGVSAELIEETRLAHGFADCAGVVPEARRAVERAADALARAFEERTR